MTKLTITLKAGNFPPKNQHIYLGRRNLDFFPEDAIGGTNRDHAGEPIRVHFEGLTGQPTMTDIAGEKAIFRCRGPVKRFFDYWDLREGDQVEIEQSGRREFRVRPAARASLSS
jgi:hypothetical protein